MGYTAVVVEGGLFPAELLERVAEGAADHQRPEDFCLSASARLSGVIQSAFSDLRAYWEAFQRRLTHSRESLTTLTRDAWAIPFLELLGYTLVYQRSAAVVGGASYAVSHRAGEEAEAPPVHIVAIDQALDRRDDARRSPHALVQEYLNRSDAVWGIVTNGERLRLLRDSARLARPTYLEFDLRAIVEGNLYSEFVLLYRLLHRSRLPRGAADAHECVLERYYQQGLAQGGRVRERLRDGVGEALRTLGEAFLTHPESEALRQALRSGRLDAAGYYRQLLRLVYRLLFLMVVEERRLVFPPDAGPTARQEIYLRYYSVSQLRERCERRVVEDHFTDLWQGLVQSFRLFREADAAAALGLRPLDGELFGPEACPDLEGAVCENGRLLRAIFHLSTFEDGGVRRRVNYAALDVEELGSVYESLLEYHPRVMVEPAPTFELVFGSERKTTGSYYTPPELVQELVESALVPVIEERLKAARSREEKERELLALRVCDPASGSGHFLLAAARRLARELALVRCGGEEPAPGEYRAALRDVIRQCLYAVDKNPLAVDLCKMALWLEGHNAGLPLSFLDHHVKCGDSLVGVFDLDVLARGIPDEAYTAVTGDDKEVAAAVRKRNKQEREGQHGFDALLATAPEVPEVLAREFAALAAGEDRTPDDVQTRQLLYEELRARGGRWWPHKVACDLWTAAFFVPLRRAEGARPDLVPTTDTVRRFLARSNAVHAQVVGEAVALAERLRFFHWPLEFPDVFARGGFDVVLGNPPWERIKLQEEEFFASRDPAIARAPNRAARQRQIAALAERDPALAEAFAQAKRDAEAQSGFVRWSGRFPLCGRGDVNTYSIFAELMRALLAPHGRAGLIVPSGIATDDTTKHFFQDLMDRRSLVSLYDFENREGVFPAVHRSYKFCLLTLTGPCRPAAGAEFAFFLHRAEELREAERRFTLTAEDMALLNPNTRTCPIFRTARDAELTKAIYRRVPVLVRDGATDGNPWDVRFATMFHMANDSHLFRTREQLEREGWRLAGNVFVRPERPSPPAPLPHAGEGAERREAGEGRRGEGLSPHPDRFLPLYEAKLIHQFDHRWATYTDAPSPAGRGSLDGDRRRHPGGTDTGSPSPALRERGTGGEGQPTPDTRDLTPAEKDDPYCLPLPRYWVPAREVAARLAGRWDRGWLLGWRDICRSTDERTVIAGIIPRVGCGDTFLLMLPALDDPVLVAVASANLNSFVLDYAARQKIGGTHLKYHVFRQLPVISPETYQQPCPWCPEMTLHEWLRARVLELTYTAWDLAPFARDLGYDGPPFRWDDGRRFLLRCELDAAFFHLYGIGREDVAYIMDTFPIVRHKDKAAHGEYRTQRVILEIYDAMARAMGDGPPYRTRLDPPPADPRAAHPYDSAGAGG